MAASRTIAASPQTVWDLVSDPYHLPRWWPRVIRVEGVEGGAFTEVLSGRKGKAVRADFSVVQATPPVRVAWSQQIEGTPFESVLQSAVTEIELAPAQAGTQVGTKAATEVRIELSQELAGRNAGVAGFLGWRLPAISRAGGPLVKRAAARTVEQALDGLARVLGDGG